MAATYYFLAAPEENGVLDWFRSEAAEPEDLSDDARTILWWRQFGDLQHDSHGIADGSKSPLVLIYVPKTRRGVFWTVGEVHFLTKNLADTFPELEQVRRKFQAWMKQFPVAWERKRGGEEGYGYYLVGSTKNIADKVYALPLGLAAYEAGQYFVGEQDHRLDDICKILRLRGVNCD